jgi:hypothetical protein
MNDLPAPLTPADCDLQDFAFMPLHVARLRDSDLAATAHPEACWYAVLLWAAAWHQVPAASLPDDELVLTRLCGLGRDVKTFRKHRRDAMRGFVKCDDGRLYHEVVAEVARGSWAEKLAYRDRKASRVDAARAAAEARWAAQRPQSELPLDAPEGNADAMRDASDDDARRIAENAERIPDAMPKGIGIGIGIGRRKKDKPIHPTLVLRADFERVATVAGLPSAAWTDAEQARLDGWLERGLTIEGDIIPAVQRWLADPKHDGGTHTLARFDHALADALARKALPEKPKPAPKAKPIARTGEGDAERSIRARLLADSGEHPSQAWIDPCGLRLNGEALHVTAPSQFHADWVRDHFGQAISLAVRAVAGKPMDIIISTGGTHP